MHAAKKQKIASAPIMRPSGQWEKVSPLRQIADMQLFQSYDHQFRKSSIICTIGPKTNSPEALLKLRHAGMGVVRMNFSHGSHEYHASVISNLAKSFKLEAGSHVAVALDTKGPEIRTGEMKDGEIKLVQDREITVTTDEKFRAIGTSECIFVDYKNLPKVVKVGSTIYVDDGLISLLVKEKSPDGVSVKCKIVNSGAIESRRGVNLPGTIVDLPAVSEKDKGDLLFGVEQGVDMVFASFIRKGADIDELRAVLGAKGKNIKIIAKIESQEGVDNFDEILTKTDGVMVARGDLGIEIPPEKVFGAQKMMIAKCNIAGVPIICATQMLESMINNPRPTRAEVSDVANAVLDGADCVMLSGETAKGKYPCESVEMMKKICLQAEQTFHYQNFFTQICEENQQCSVSETVCCTAVAAAAKCQASAIIVLSNSGTTARLASKYKPRCPIIVVTKKSQTARQVHLYRGSVGFVYEAKNNGDSYMEDREHRISFGIQSGKDSKFLLKGDRVIVILGTNEGHGKPNTFRIEEVE